MSRQSREEVIAYFIERWHGAPEGEMDGPLHEEMGWTWEEYSAWVEDPEKLPPQREGVI